MSRKALLAWAWTLIILILCWTPRFALGDEDKPRLPFYIPNLDKMVHLGIFAVFAYLWMRVESPRFRAAGVFAVGIALAVITELGQELPIVNRDATLGDALADAIGVVVGIVCYRLVAWARSPRPKPETVEA